MSLLAGIIQKHTLSLGKRTIELPNDAQFLSVKTQGSDIVAHFLMNPDNLGNENGTTVHYFHLVTTGSLFIQEGLDYIDTLFLNGDEKAFHIFKR